MRKQKTPALVNLAIYTTITIFLWIFFDIYRALEKPPVLDIESKILEPVNPNLDMNLLEEIDKSLYFEKSSYEPEDLLNETIIETNTAIETDTATVSADSD